MMRRRWAILLFVLVLLASSACQSQPTVTPSPPTSTSSSSGLAALRAALERLRPQVFHQPYNAGEQEVTDGPTTAGEGDRVRIPGTGKALLKWPDLHVMLYNATKIEAKNVTPTWIRLGILAGTVAAGGTLEPEQRLALSTDSAEITMSGTTVMAAYHPETRMTILRVFDGQAEVRNLEGAQQVSVVRSAQWARVEPGRAPEVSGDLSAMRGLARDLGLWDTFHEVELDVMNGFGTEQSRVPQSNVDIVFVEGTATPPTPPAQSARWAETMPCQPAPVQPRDWSDITDSDIELRSPWVRHVVQFDGGISSAQEWADANCYNLILGANEAGFRTIPSRWWIKNDSEWLYLLGRLPAGASDNAWIGYYWPHPYTGRWQHSDVGIVGLDGSLFDGYGWNESDWSDDTHASPPGSNDVQGAAAKDLLYSWFEFRKALRSGDGYDWDWPSRGEVGTEGNLLIGGWSSVTGTAPRVQVRLTLGSERAGPAEPTSTTTPPPPECASGVLYCEDFEDGLAQGWQTFDAGGKPSKGWQVIREGSNRVFSGEGHQWAVLDGHSWGDYRVRFRLKAPRGAIHLNYRLSDAGRYFIGFSQEGTSLSWQRGDSFSNGPVASVEKSHAANAWHQVEIAGWGGRLLVYVDGKLELDYTDSDPLRSGTIAFETLDGASAQVDDIEVLPAGQPQAPATPTRTRTPKPPALVTPTRTRTPKPQAPPVQPTHTATAKPAPPTSTVTPKPSVVVECGPQQASLELGQCTTLHWDVDNANAVYLDGEAVAGHASRDVCPTKNRTYTLRAATGSGDRFCKMSVEVREPVSGLASGFDRPGMDIWAFWLAEADPARCRRTCLEDPDCRSFTYTRPGVDGEFAHCWIKSGVPDPVPNANCVSGVKGSAPVSAPAVPNLETNTDRPGMDYQDFDIGSAGACRAQCLGNVRCRAFTFREAHFEGDPDSSSGVQYLSAHCWLKNGIPPRIEKPYNISGAR